MARILIADDDDSLLLALELALTEGAHQVVKATDGKSAFARLENEPFDLLISDVGMPHVDGFTLARRLREQKKPLAIILLTSRDGELDEALGLELGADDYIGKPFSMRVLLARVDALLRRHARETHAAENVVHYGLLRLDKDRLLATYRDAPIDTTVTEFRVLETLASRAGMVISRARLLEQVRGDASIVGDRIVDTYISRLRRKLEAIDAKFNRLETVVGAGYRWRE